MTSSEIKKDAKVKLSGKYFYLIVINVFYALITIAVSYLPSLVGGSSENSGLNLITLIIYFLFYIILLPLNFGVIASTIKIVRNEDVSYTEFINIGLNNLGKVWKLALRTFLKLIIPIFILLVSLFMISYGLVGALASAFGGEGVATANSNIFLLGGLVLGAIGFIYLIIKSLSYSLSQFLLFDKPYQNSSELLDESYNLMKNNKARYVSLILSFIGWYLLIFLVVSIISNMIPEDAVTIIQLILVSFLTPYITASQIIFYEDLKGETISKPVENLDTDTEVQE